VLANQHRTIIFLAVFAFCHWLLWLACSGQVGWGYGSGYEMTTTTGLRKRFSFGGATARRVDDAFLDS
jgi:hypothetical protein